MSVPNKPKRTIQQAKERRGWNDAKSGMGMFGGLRYAVSRRNTCLFVCIFVLFIFNKHPSYVTKADTFAIDRY